MAVLAVRAALANHRVRLGLLLVAALALRLALASRAPHPGLLDPNHYYHVATNLADGRGFVVDYVWQYHRPPDRVTHPIDYWMPLPAVWPAAGLWVAGDDLFAALVPSAVLGTLVGLVAYLVAALARLDPSGRLLAAALALFLPDLCLHSIRTGTAVSYVSFVSAGFLCLHAGTNGRPKLLWLAGGFAGLAHLTRQDGILLAPAMLASVLVSPRRTVPVRSLLAIPVAWALVLAPWIVRNELVLGRWWPGGGGRTLFLTSFVDQFTYERELDLGHYLAWGGKNIATNIVSKALGNLGSLVLGLNVVLGLAGLGLFGRLVPRRRELRTLLTPPLIFTGGLFLFYSVIGPFHSEGGSFRRSALVLVPFLAAGSAAGLAAYGRKWRAAAVIVAWMVGTTLVRARAEFDLLGRVTERAEAIRAAVDDLGDANGDGTVTLMSSDPFLFSMFGFPGIMAPSDDREAILRAAERYRVDYVILPADRRALDGLAGEETDARLPVVADGAGFRVLGVSP